MKLFITGATGFIGRAFCRVAIERGHRVLALCRNRNAVLPADVSVVAGSLTDTPWEKIKAFAPDAVLHLAWIATPGIYLTSPENELWLEQSKAWIQQLQRIGVPHIAGTGTCIEYAASGEPLIEHTSPLDPVFPYSKAKADLFQWLRERDVSSAKSWTWFRLFYPYGPGEHPNRVISSLISQLTAGKSLALRTPHSIKDYIYIDNAALAICQCFEERLTGPVNIGTGVGVSILKLARAVATIVDADPSLVQIAETLTHDPTPIVIASIDRLRAIGWCPTTTLEEGLQRLHNELRTCRTK
jgi:dTDP-6-deoxy-L-talose 4-dehydrogenase (NAD+)